MKRVEYSQIVRKKLRSLKAELAQRFGIDIATTAIRGITGVARGLGQFEDKGKLVSAMYDIDCEYRYLYVAHTYLFYRVEKEKIVVVEMFNEKEDFMQKLFGIVTTSQETEDYWGE
ncbi:MAG: type II toxin-antitoxin system RelE/ParE family toxin [Lachnospiraceae bacterium]|nr:type II toxin-antitoxin system RelE/ParE family toxin [Lachnospiraceae bacterium]